MISMGRGDETPRVFFSPQNSGSLPAASRNCSPVGRMYAACTAALSCPTNSIAIPCETPLACNIVATVARKL